MRNIVLIAVLALAGTAAADTKRCPDNATLQKIIEPSVKKAVEGKPTIDIKQCLQGKFPKAGMYVEALVTTNDRIETYAFVIDPPGTVVAADYIYTFAKLAPGPKYRRTIKLEDRDKDGIDEVYGDEHEKAGGKSLLNVVTFKNGKLAFEVTNK
jgi:hypothetical protein